MSNALLPPCRSLASCDNWLAGQLPTWVSTLTRLTSPFMTLQQCGLTVGDCHAGHYCTLQSYVADNPHVLPTPPCHARTRISFR